jgi:hypothetical protein
MSETIDITYCFTFEDGRQKEFTASLDLATLMLIRDESETPPEWAKLNHNRCEVCRIHDKTPHCPIAANLADIVDGFKDFFSYQQVNVTVTTKERNYQKETTIQQGLSSLIGIIMVSSGCPAMERLKPMVRFHLPFATLEETVYRMISTYLVAQYYLNREGKQADLQLEGLEAIYNEVVEVNQSFAKRLTEAAKKDANVNALVNLDCFAAMVPYAAQDLLNDIESYFVSYLC